MRVDKFLAHMGLGSRQEVKTLLKKQILIVNNIQIKDPGFIIKPSEDQIYLNGEKLSWQDKIYIMLNKPASYISASARSSVSQPEEKIIIDLLPEHLKNRRLFPIGRLDKDTEGLIILTNDGKLAHNILSPKKKVWKKYYAQVSQKLKEDAINQFKNGIYISEEDYTSKEAKLEILEEGYAAHIYLTEGKFHQVKRMLKAVSAPCTYLKRLSIGPITLDPSLEPGNGVT